MDLFFTDYFRVSPRTLKKYGAFDISLLSDLPLFIDPFLLFNSNKSRYRRLHDEIIEYLRFLRDRSVQGRVTPGLIAAWYRFPEVKQTWLGFARESNRGSGLGKHFAVALDENLHHIFSDFGDEKVTHGSHLEKLCLIGIGVGRDNISDFTTNLIKNFLCEYTERFAKKYVRPKLRRKVPVPRVQFNYETETWERGEYDLPWSGNDYVLLTPKDILTKEETWINKADLIDEFENLPDAIPNVELRAQINNYFLRQLPPPTRKKREPTKKERGEAARLTLLQFPQIIDFFIRYKEDQGERAQSIASERVSFSERLYIHQGKQLAELLAASTAFYHVPGNTYEEAHGRIRFLKEVIENKGGHRIFYVNGRPIEREEDIHVLYRLVWFATPSDVSREVNDGRGPADFKISRGSQDKTIVEFKLASNSQLRRNLRRQAEIYSEASDASHAIKVIVYFTHEEYERVVSILRDLKLLDSKDIVLVDARRDNKPSASKA